ncbi:hypothetical protein HDV00_002293 [Rhizophlyctis rosea]|nr:hypothetical protein HDV00_002293 [Rhizophlyctis rosea]
MAPRKAVHPPISAAKVRSMRGVTFTLDIKLTSSPSQSSNDGTSAEATVSCTLESRILSVTSQALATRWKYPYTGPTKSSTRRTKPSTKYQSYETDSTFPFSSSQPEPTGRRPRRTFQPSASSRRSRSITPPPTRTPKPQQRRTSASKETTKYTRTITHATSTPGVCHSCGTTKTGQWRRGPAGPRTLCNACGLEFAKKIRKTQEMYGWNAKKAEEAVKAEWVREKGGLKVGLDEEGGAAMEVEEEVEVPTEAAAGPSSFGSGTPSTSPPPHTSSSPPAADTDLRRGSSSSASTTASSSASPASEPEPEPSTPPYEHAPIADAAKTDADYKRYDPVRSLWG